MTSADIYARKSTADQGRSVASQEGECRTDAEAEGWQIGRTFADPDRSASRYARRPRPDYDELVAHIAAGNCQVLVMWESSRGGRDLTHWSALLDLCRAKKTLIRITSHHRTYDPRNARDWRSLAEDGVDSAYESEKIADRSRRGIRAAALEGRPFGQLLFGYTRVYDGHRRYVEQVIHPDQAPIVQEVATRILAGEPLAAIARDLNQRGVPSPQGTQWRGNFLAKMVRNPAYVAQRVHQGVVIGAGKWPAILDERTWRACCALLAAPGRRCQRGTELRWFLSDVPICGRCGARLRTFHGNRNRRYLCQGCRSLLIVAADLDALVERMILQRFASVDVTDVFVSESNDHAVTQAQTVEADLRTRLASHYDEAAAGRLSAAGLAHMEARLLPQIDAAAAKVRSLATPPALRELAGVDIPGSWARMPVRLQREIVLATCELIVDPGVPGRPFFDRMRLARSRWRGEDRTWGEILAASPGVD